VAIINVPIPNPRMDKYPARRSLANKFGKSLYSLKSSMSKALQSHVPSNGYESQIVDSSLNQEFERKPMDYQISTNSLKRLQNDIDILQELLERKDLLIIELKNNFREDRLQFEKEKNQLNQKIEQLQNENLKLQKQLHMQ
jgi:predicted RNase H-like nuclease (RuvC/YqgF family)